MAKTKLSDPFDGDDLEWKIQTVKKKSSGIDAIIVPYVTARAIFQRLDEVYGVEGWRNELPQKGPDGGVIQGISVKVGGEWVTKWDGAENTDIEPVKGGLSGALKRAAVLWGMGRHLYALPLVKAKIVHDDHDGQWAKLPGSNDFFKWQPPKNLEEVLSGEYAGKRRAEPKAEAGQPAQPKVEKPNAKQMAVIEKARSFLIGEVNAGNYNDIELLDVQIAGQLNGANLTESQQVIAAKPIESAFWDYQLKNADAKKLQKLHDQVDSPKIRSRYGDEWVDGYLGKCRSLKTKAFI